MCVRVCVYLTYIAGNTIRSHATNNAYSSLTSFFSSSRSEAWNRSLTDTWPLATKTMSSALYSAGEYSPRYSTEVCVRVCVCIEGEREREQVREGGREGGRREGGREP
jgi:hypothetical protein